MKKIILVLIFLIGLTSLAESQTRKTLGNLSLKDTLTGSLKVTTGGIWTSSFIYADGYYVGVYNKISLSEAPITGDFTIANNWDVATPDMIFSIDRTGGLYRWQINSATTQMTLDESGLDITGYATVGDNLTVDSIFSSRSATKIAVTGDDQVLTITSSLHIIDSNDPTAGDRTLTLSNGTTVGQRLRIIYQLITTNKCEIANAGNVLTKDGDTRTFDVDRENMGFTWDGTYWIEDGRSL